jgi:hypothetical protein
VRFASCVSMPRHDSNVAAAETAREMVSGTVLQIGSSSTVVSPAAVCDPFAGTPLVSR